jgi:Tfp pilus assembly protein PilN
MIMNFSRDSETFHRLRSDALRMRKALKNFLFFSPANEGCMHRRQLCISIGMDLISIASGSRLFNRIRIKASRTYKFQELRYPSPETVASMAALYCNELKLFNPQVKLCIPKAWAVIQSTELPAAAEENLPDVVAYELDRITPFRPDEAYYDYRLLNKANGKLLVATTATRMDTVDSYLRTLTEKGLPVTGLDTNLSASVACLNDTFKGQDLIFLDIGPGNYEGGLLQSGVMVAGCTGSFNGNNPDESLLTEIAEEVKPWIAGMKALNSEPKLIIHSCREMPYASLERELGTSLHMLEYDDLAGAIFPGNLSCEEIPYAAIGGVTSSLGTKSKSMNLLSRGKIKTTRTPLSLTIVLIAAILSMGMLSLLLPWYLKDQEVSALDRELFARKDAVKKIEALRKEYSSLQEELNTVAALKRNTPQALTILKELTQILPKNVWLTRVNITESNVSIEGYAASAANILPQIEASPIFSKVEFSSPTMRDARLNVDRFVIRMEIEGTTKEGPKGKNGAKK